VLDHKYLRAIADELAAILRSERERLGLSMNAVAERAGLSQPMVSLVERRLRQPTLDTLLRISVALEVDLADLIQRAQRAAARPTPKT
jgi:transcriptional regulator with XRE-family HTH domain